MGLGIGGGIGPFRAGVSTRGVGVGLGPVSAGTGWGGGNGCATVIGLLVVLTVYAVLILWPFWLGTWIAEELGAADPSSARTITGWAFEIAYILSLMWVLLYARRRIAEAKEAVARRERRDKREEELFDEAMYVIDLRETCDMAESGLQTYRQAQENFARTGRHGAVLDDTPPGERTFLSDLSVWLAQPRVEYRNGPRVLKRIEPGELTITDRAVRFVGETGNVTWELAKLARIQRNGDAIGLVVSNRESVSGVSSSDESLDIIEYAIEIARGDDLDFQVVMKSLELQIQASHNDIAATNSRISALGRRLEKDLGVFLSSYPEYASIDPEKWDQVAEAIADIAHGDDPTPRDHRSGHSNLTHGKEKNPIDPATALAHDLAARLPAGVRVVTYTKDNDPNGLLGEPRGYQSAAALIDPAAVGTGDVDEITIDCGAVIEICASPAHARKRSAHILRVQKLFRVLGRETHHVNGEKLLRVSHRLQPSETRDLYGSAWAEVRQAG